MADESELSHFRQQWKDEVTARSKVGPTSSPSSSTARPPAHRPRPPSFSHTRPAATRPSEDDDELPASTFASPPSPPPPPPRRPSFSTRDSAFPRSALEHYEEAVKKETEGDLGESLKLYRKAFRMDDGVDKSYKDKYFRRSSQDKDKAAARADLALGRAHQLPATAAISELVASFSGLGIEPAAGPGQSDSAEEAKLFSLLASVPSELLLHILRFLALADVAAFARLAQVCRRLCFVVASEERIWAELCRRTFARQAWDWRVDVSGHHLVPDASPAVVGRAEDGDGDGEPAEAEDEERRAVPVDELELVRFNGSWREMFRLRPRLRSNGIYISTCNYHRPGGHTGTSLSWGTPVHIVTYYRYLRFYADGSLLSLLTTHAPADVVHAFSKPALTPAHLRAQTLPGAPLPSAAHGWAPNVSRGRWRIDSDGRVDVETEAPNLPRYLFRMQLRVRNVKGRGAVKLAWEGFWSWNKLTDDLAVFEGRNDKPFFFSRVASIEREEGL